jgi:hypothetical protein
MSTITDELVAELEQLAHLGNGGFVIDSAEVYVLLAERAELKRDAERLDFMISECCVMECMPSEPPAYRLYWHDADAAQSEWYSSKRAAIDAAMQTNKE